MISDEAMASGNLKLEGWDDVHLSKYGQTIYERSRFYKRPKHEIASGYAHYRYNSDDEDYYGYESGKYTKFVLCVFVLNKGIVIYMKQHWQIWIRCKGSI